MHFDNSSGAISSPYPAMPTLEQLQSPDMLRHLFRSVTLLTAANSSLGGEVKALQSRCGGLEDRVTSLKGDLKTEREGRRAEVTALQGRCTGLEMTVAEEEGFMDPLFERWTAEKGRIFVKNVIDRFFPTIAHSWWHDFFVTLGPDEYETLRLAGYDAAIMSILNNSNYELEPGHRVAHGDAAAGEPPLGRRVRMVRAVLKSDSAHRQAFLALYKKLWGVDASSVWPGNLGV